MVRFCVFFFAQTTNVNDFDFIFSNLKSYKNPNYNTASNNNFSQLQSQVDDVKGVMTNNIDKMIEKTNMLLNTPSKKALWFYLEQILNKDHIPRVFHESKPNESVTNTTKKSGSLNLLSKLNKRDIQSSHNLLFENDRGNGDGYRKLFENFKCLFI